MNPYDDPALFAAYAGMERSRRGLAGAAEWEQLRALLPPLRGAAVLDLGCGYGWHCRFAAGQGAASVLGIDRSGRMIAEALRRNAAPGVTYRVCGLEEYAYPPEAFDLVLSNLALHYVADLDAVYRGVFRTLRSGGTFVCNIEHPTFTAGVGQQWVREGERNLYWPVDDYFHPGPRRVVFLDQTVEKQHHTLTRILMGLLLAGFRLTAVQEAEPPPSLRDAPGMADEMRRPMMLLIRAQKD